MMKSIRAPMIMNDILLIDFLVSSIAILLVILLNRLNGIKVNFFVCEHGVAFSKMQRQKYTERKFHTKKQVKMYRRFLINCF
jgi:uncharacterized membrane protein